MIIPMRIVNIIGLKSEFDRIATKYIMGRNIELENPFLLFKDTKGFVQYNGTNPYEARLKRFTDLFEYAGLEYDNVTAQRARMTEAETEEVAAKFDETVHNIKKKIEDLEKEIQNADAIISSLQPILQSDINVDDLTGLKFIKFRYGRLPVYSYEKLDAYLGDLPAYFAVIKSDKSNVWGFYFVSPESARHVDHIFTSLYFQREWIDGGVHGTPAEITEKLKADAEEKRAEIKELNVELTELLESSRDEIFEAFANVKFYYELNNLKKLAPHTKNCFYMSGWMPKNEAERLRRDAEGKDEVSIIIQDPSVAGSAKIPTKLKNPRIFKPFEEFVKMYGVPSYNEIDPTPILGIVYSLLFGMMFGDVGHGIVLFLAGLLMTLLKKGGFIGKLLVPLGITSTFFGFLYGTFFGFEGAEAVIKPIWFTPSENMTDILLITVFIGMGIILFCMLINVVNGIKQKNPQKIFFSQNGLAGFVFYALALFCGLSILNGAKHSYAAAFTAIGVSLALIFLQEPLSRLAERKRDWMPKEKGGFLVQSFFELFEIVLSFVTNTISFVRVGAFALNHAGMMSVVIMFMHSMSKTGSIAVAVFGNLLVIGLEGLIVGIQVLRLGFYEMFSRFYDGSGREFKPINIKK